MEHLDDFEEACDMHHPDYGCIRQDDRTTEQGLKYFKDQREKYGSKIKNYRDNSISEK